MSLSSDMKIRLRQIVDAAEEVYGKGSVLSRLAIGQAQQESGIISKPSVLASVHNNLFGIKGKGTAGSTNELTSEYTKAGQKYYIKDDFAKNHTVRDSFIQHRNLMRRPRYMHVLNAQTLEEAAAAIQAAGYATDPKYAQNVIAAYRAVEKRL